ncbi:MAG: transporter substrate-binding domain-containing protein [Pseudomonadota bacterium]
MKRIATFAVLFTALLALPSAANDLVPTGTLRATYIGTNPVQAFIDPASKQVVGPAAEITKALAQKLGVPFDIKGAQGVPGVIDSVKKKEADIGFVAYDPVRANEIDFSQTYSLAWNTYLVLDTSPLRSADEMDKAGLKLGVGERDAGDFYLTRNLKNAELKRVPPANIDNAIAMLRSGEFDAFAANRQRLTEVVKRIPGLRIVDGDFYGVEQAVGVFKGNTALLEAVDALLDDARSSGLIAGAIKRAGLSGVDVALPRSEQKR